MPYYAQPIYILTLLEALEHQTVDQLKALARLLPAGSIPTRKAELVDYVNQRMQKESLKPLWEQCDSIQKAVIAEVVHGADDRYQKNRFVSKYGKEPTLGISNIYSYQSKPSILDLFFYSGTMPQDLKTKLKAFVPPPEPTRIQSVEGLPDTLSCTEKGYNYRTRSRENRSLEIPLHLRETEQVARRDLQTVLRLVDLGKVSISEKTFYPTGATLNTIADVLEEGDYYNNWDKSESPGGCEYDYEIGDLRSNKIPVREG